jgi:hypothetical protein
MRLVRFLWKALGKMYSRFMAWIDSLDRGIGDAYSPNCPKCGQIGEIDQEGFPLSLGNGHTLSHRVCRVHGRYLQLLFTSVSTN